MCELGELPYEIFEHDAPKTKKGKPQARQQAIDFLKVELEDEAQRQPDLLRKAQVAGISKSTLDRAKTALAIQPYQEDGGWWWPALKLRALPAPPKSELAQPTEKIS